MTSLPLHTAGAAVIYFGAIAIWSGSEMRLVVRDIAAGVHRPPASDRHSGQIASACGGMGILAAVGAATGLPRAQLPGNGWAPLIIGAALIVVGSMIRIWAVHTLGQYFRLVVMIQDAHPVIQSGPYRWVRHPAYTGLLLVFVGIGLGLGNLVSVFCTTIAMAVGLLPRILTEEAALRTSLGDAYIEYSARTRRIIPGIW